MNVDRVIASANAAIAWNDNDAFYKATLNAVQFVGAEVERMLGPDERTALFAPVYVDIAGKSRPGAILLAESRLIIGYGGTGLQMGRASATFVKLSQLDDVTQSTASAGLLSPRCASLTIRSASQSYEIVFAYPGTSTGFVNLVEAYLDGAATFAWNNESSTPATSSSVDSPNESAELPLGAHVCRRLNCPYRGIPTEDDRCAECGHATVPVASFSGDLMTAPGVRYNPQAPVTQGPTDEPSTRSDTPPGVDATEAARFGESAPVGDRACRRRNCAQRGAPTHADRCPVCGHPTVELSVFLRNEQPG